MVVQDHRARLVISAHLPGKVRRLQPYLKLPGIGRSSIGSTNPALVSFSDMVDCRWRLNHFATDIRQRNGALAWNATIVTMTNIAAVARPETKSAFPPT